MARNPTRIGRYDLITALATGGMGRIYLGRSSGVGGFDRKVVIKTLEVPLSADSDPAIAMFLDEARLLGLLYHQHIASVFEVGRDDDGRYYMVLDYVEGHSAHDVWERAVQFGALLPLDFALTVVSAAANALHYTHTRRDADGTPLGIVHRDVTPSNVMIGHDGAIKLIDFGIAMASNRSTKTQTGFVKGKVGYLSPEQVAGRDVDARTDVFALGILLYELTTQQRAFRDTSDLATMQRIKQGKVARPSQVVADYPRELEAIVMKALQVEPRDRFGDADAMRRELEALGHRMQFVLGDAAIIEVMAQLFEPQAGGVDHAPERASEPAFEWSSSDQDLTVRRDAAELVEIVRSHRDREAAAAKPMAMKPRKLRAATETVDALLVRAVAPLASPPPMLPLASPPPTPHHTPLPTITPGFARSESGASRFPTATAAGPPVSVAGSPSPPVAGGAIARLRRLPRRWIGLGFAVAAIAGAAGFFLVRAAPVATAKVRPPEGPSVVLPPAAARAPQSAPAPPKPVHPPAAAAPAAIRVHIVTHPADATVFLDGKKLGHTPFDQAIAADPAKHVFRLKRRGYAMARLDRELGADLTEELTLSPQR